MSGVFSVEAGDASIDAVPLECRDAVFVDTDSESLSFGVCTHCLCCAFKHKEICAQCSVAPVATPRRRHRRTRHRLIARPALNCTATDLFDFNIAPLEVPSALASLPAV